MCLCGFPVNSCDVDRDDDNDDDDYDDDDDDDEVHPTKQVRLRKNVPPQKSPLGAPQQKKE